MVMTMVMTIVMTMRSRDGRASSRVDDGGRDSGVARPAIPSAWRTCGPAGIVIAPALPFAECSDHRVESAPTSDEDVHSLRYPAGRRSSLAGRSCT